MSKGWTKERRAAQAARCRANKPWEHATGPKSMEGKARSSMNAYKHGGWVEHMRLCRALCQHNQDFLEAALLFHGIEEKRGAKTISYH